MQALTTSAIAAPIRTYVENKDVMMLLGCKKTKASDYIREVNNKVRKEGGMGLPAGKANKYLFSEMLRLPIEDIDKVLVANDRKR